MGEEEIISLIPLLLQGKATDEQERAVRCWLEENEGHLEIYRKYCAVYYRLYYAGEWKKIDVSRAIKQVKGQNDRKTIVFKTIVRGGCTFFDLYRGLLAVAFR